MKALVLATAFAALSATAFAGAARDAQPRNDAVVIADAGRLSSTGLTALHDGSPWAGARPTQADGGDFDTLTSQIEPGHLLVALCVLGFALSRPLGRLLRRHEQQRRASALASTLPRR